MNDYANRLEKAMKLADMSIADLSAALDVSYQAVRKVIRGESKAFSAENNSKAATAMGISADWLATGEGDMLADQNLIRKADNVSPGPKITGMVPILNKVNAGMYREIIDSEPDGIEHVASAVPTKRYTFALRVEGDSMEPKFPEGMVLIVEPEADPLPNDYVIAVNGDNEATFKQLIKDGGEWMLKPLNPRYPIKPLGTAKVIGVIIGAQIQFRRGES